MPGDEARLEISDLIIDFDVLTGQRRPVDRKAVLATLRSHGQDWAMRIVEAFPAARDSNGVEWLDETFVDAALVRAHLELQQLHEEFLMGQRLAEVLVPLCQALRKTHPGQAIHLVDIGCGGGFVFRWLAFHRVLGDDVRLTGTDMNASLIRLATTLQTREQLRCTFVHENAFRLRERSTHELLVYCSTGALHHFRGDSLRHLFEAQRDANATGWVHFDIRQTPGAPFGAWLFHRARMQEPLARHDGWLSACRAHPESALLTASREAVPDWVSSTWDGEVGWARLARIMHAVVALPPELDANFVSALGNQTHRLGARSPRG